MPCVLFKSMRVRTSAVKVVVGVNDRADEDEQVLTSRRERASWMK